MGKPGQGVPVSVMGAGEGPNKPVEREAVGHDGIRNDIIPVVKVNELVPHGLAENSKGDGRQSQANPSYPQAQCGLGRSPGV